jgi:hypothetical protein
MTTTAAYRVQCDVCFGFLDGDYETRDEAINARQKAGWEDANGGTACPQHNPAPAV